MLYRLVILIMLPALFLTPGTMAQAQSSINADVGELRLEDKLRKPVTAKYLRTSLEQVLKDLSEKYDIDIKYDENAMLYAKVKANTPVTLRLSNVPLGRVIELALENISPSDRPLTYEIKDQTIIAPSLSGVMKKKRSMKFDLSLITAKLAEQRKLSIESSDLTDEEKQEAIDDIDERAIAKDLFKQIKVLMDPNDVYGDKRTFSAYVSGKKINAFGTEPSLKKLDTIYQAIVWLTDIGYMKVQPRLETYFSDDAKQRMARADDLNNKDPEYLSKAVREISRESGANFFIDWTNITPMGIEKTVKTLRDVDLLEAPLSKHLLFALSSIEGGTAPLDYVVDQHGVVVISSKAHLDQQWMLHVYDIRPLIEANLVSHPDDNDQRDRKIIDLQQIVSVIIEDNIILKDKPAARGSMWLYGNHLLVNSTLSNHREIHRVFDTMLEMKEQKIGDVIKPNKTYLETVEMMKENILFDVENKSWRTTMNTFKDESNIYNIYINWAAIDRAGLSTDKKLTFKVKDQSFVQVLNALLAIGSDPEKAQLDYFVDQDGILIISTLEDLSRRKLVRLYDIRELVTNQESLEKGKSLPGPMIDRIVSRLRTDLNAAEDPTDQMDVRLAQSHGLLVVHGLFNKQRDIKNIMEVIKTEMKAADNTDKPE